ncbi:hypothetical protein GUJ93_ZPchr0007g5829 [Zizania palustris]|uniref:Uncharacterized protein n=1 Tax=Zizania palustris TaxID=103762 RepID=A0A8J5TJ86_ZIZPA|nr:hypothetical protein GUJ93_ZPchr0007g5829 [Zizania palustris]
MSTSDLNWKSSIFSVHHIQIGIFSVQSTESDSSVQELASIHQFIDDTSDLARQKQANIYCSCKLCTVLNLKKK